MDFLIFDSSDYSIGNAAFAAAVLCLEYFFQVKLYRLKMDIL